MNSLKSNGKTFEYLCLTLVIFIWGISPIIVSYVLDYFSVCVYSALSGLVSVISLVLIARKHLKELNLSYFKVAIPTGTVVALASLLQKIGLKYTTPTSYAFLENLSCVAVPILLFIMIRKKPSNLTIISCVLCLVGAYVLSGMSFSNGFKVGVGEILCAISGVLYGVNIAVTGVCAKKFNALLYVMTQMIAQFFFTSVTAVALNFLPISAPLEPIKFSFMLLPILVVILTAIISDAFCWTVRTNSMKKISTNVVAVLMPLSSVVTGVVSIMFGRDTLSLNLILGAAFILAATIISGLADKKDSENKEEN